MPAAEVLRILELTASRQPRPRRSSRRRQQSEVEGPPDDERGGDEVARLLALEERRIPDRVGHRHRGHEARDVLVLDQDLPALGLEVENLALEGVLLGGRRLTAGHQTEESQDGEKARDAWHPGKL